MVYADETEPSTRRSGLNRFNPKRLSFFNSSSSTRTSPTATPSSSTAPSPASSPKIAQGSARQHRPIVIAPADSHPSSMKRKVAPSPYMSEAPVFTSPFTNLSPFSTPPPPPTPSFNPLRRSSSEARAIAANRLKATVAAVKTAPGKRRKSVVDLEEATEGVKNLFTRRRSSLTPIQPPSAAPRSTLLHRTPANPDFLENSPRRTTAGHHVVAPSGVRIGFPLPFPSPVPSSPLPERRAVFSDHALSPNFSFPDTPSLGSASPTLTASSFRSSPTMSPRSPHSSSTRDLEPETWEGPRGHRKLPSGVLINWPPVFPSRPPSMAFSGTSVEDVDESEAEEDEREEREEFAPDVLAEQDRDETPSFRRRGAPTFIRRVPPPSLASASPFPPPFLSDKDRANSDDSFRNFSFPSMPTLFAQTPTALPPSSADRRVSTCSSYNSPHGSGADTPGSFDPHLLTPLGTGITIYEANPFSEAFGAAGGLAIRTTQRV